MTSPKGQSGPRALTATRAREARQAELQAQLAALGEQVVALSARLEALEARQKLLQQPWWIRLTARLFAPSDVSPAELERVRLPDMLGFGQTFMYWMPIIYYSIFGAIYLTSGISIFAGPSDLALLPGLVRILLALGCLQVGLGNLCCIILPQERFQRRMVLSTVSVAALILVIGSLTAIAAHQPGELIGRMIIWSVIIGMHLLWGYTLHARILYRAFTKHWLTEVNETTSSTQPLAE